MIIYKTTNKVNGKIYIGKSIYNREGYIGSGSTLKAAIKKYGKNNFVKEIIDQATSIEELNIKEIYWIKFYRTNFPNLSVYNRHSGGNGVFYWSKESKNKLSLARKGIVFTEEHCKNISLGKIGSIPWNKDKVDTFKHSEESKIKIGKSISNIPRTHEWNMKRGESTRKTRIEKDNYKHSDLTKEKIKNSISGILNPKSQVYFFNSKLEYKKFKGGREFKIFCDKNNLNIETMIRISELEIIEFHNGWSCSNKSGIKTKFLPRWDKIKQKSYESGYDI